MLDLARGLDALGHDVVIACCDFHPGTVYGDAERRFDVRAVRRGAFEVPEGRWAAVRSFVRDMRQLAAVIPDDLDVLNAHEWPALHAVRLSSDRLGVPFVWTRNDHTIFERALVPGVRSDSSIGVLARIPRIVGSFGDYLDARRAATIVTLDEASAQLARRIYRRPVRTIQCGVSDAFFSPRDRTRARDLMDLSDDTFFVLGVGIMTPHRRFEDLIDAVALLRDLTNVRVKIIGSDHVFAKYADFLEARISERLVGDRVQLERCGVGEEALRAAYVAADVFVFPNDHRQSWGLAPLEALASGTPVVITTEAGVHDLLDSRPGVTAIPARNPRAIAAAIRDHIVNRKRSEAKYTRDWLQRRLSPTRYAEQMVDVYAQAVARSARE